MAQIRIEVQAAVEDAVRNLDRMEGSLRNADTSLGALPGNARAAFSAIGQFTGAMQAGVEVVQSIVGPTMEYGKQVRDLGAFTGATAQESSRLIQVTDDLGIEFGTLRTAAKAMSENGLQPSVANLAKLADEFNAIQDPVKQSQFLVDKFGARAGPAMAIALRQGSAALLQMGEDAEATGLVVGEDFVESTEKARMALDEYEDSIMAAKLALSEHLLPAVTATLTQGADFITYWSKSAEAITEGRLSLLEFQKVGYEVIFTDKTLAQANADLTEATNDLTRANDASTDRWAGLASTYIPEVAEETRKLTAVNNSTAANYRAMYADINAAAADNAAALEAANQRAQESFEDLAVIIDGPVGDAQDDYYAAQKDAGAVIAELRAELAKLEASHGAVVTSTDDGTEAARNLIIAQSDAQTAAENLKKAQEKLAEDPGDLGLQAAVARAEQALDRHEAAVVEWGGKVDQAGQEYVINNSAAIDAVELKLDEANAAYDANATAHEEATARIIFGMLEQKLAMDGFTQEEITFLTDVGEAWGIYDSETAAALRAVDQAINTHGLNANAVVTTLHDNISNLPEHKLVQIEVRTNYTQYGAEPGPGAPVVIPSTPDQTGAPGGTW
jgi:hypothetical protein